MRSTALRLFLTVCLVYTLHFATNVVRETYLAIALGENASVRVDEYMGLHPDLFQIEGRGAFINNNPGASMLAAMPYAVARPFIDGLLKLRPELARPKPPSTYDDPRPNRTSFFNEARARGLDVKLGLAAAVTHVGLMVPLGGLAAVVMFQLLRTRLGDSRTALWLALLYAFGTPIFFRSAFLNQNAILAHAVLFAFVALHRSPALAGSLLGIGLVCDYSAAPLLLVFGAWVLAEEWKAGGVGSAFHAGLRFAGGAAVPVAVLLIYQFVAFGNPFLPAQAYMPATRLSVSGWHGFTLPLPALLWGNLFDLRYGLFAFCPMLVAALAAPFIRRERVRRSGGQEVGRSSGRTHDLMVSGAELWLIFLATGALYLFSSSVQFALLQWNTGVRYMVPAIPLLFLALVPVLLKLPAWARWTLILPTVAVSWSVAMVREDVPTSLLHVFLRGFELPWLTVLEKTASAYLPFLEQGSSPIAIFLFAGVALWLIWRGEKVKS